MAVCQYIFYDLFSLQDIKEAELPDIFVCSFDDKIQENLKKQGYLAGMKSFMRGNRSNSNNLITWEGLDNHTYQNLTGQHCSLMTKSNTDYNILATTNNFEFFAL